MDAMKDLRDVIAHYDEPTGWQFDGLDIGALGNLHRALRAALAEIEAALTPAIHAGSARGMTYVELATASGYGSVTTIVKIMKSAPTPRDPGRRAAESVG